MLRAACTIVALLGWAVCGASARTWRPLAYDEPIRLSPSSDLTLLRRLGHNNDSDCRFYSIDGDQVETRWTHTLPSVAFSGSRNSHVPCAASALTASYRAALDAPHVAAPYVALGAAGSFAFAFDANSRNRRCTQPAHCATGPAFEGAVAFVEARSASFGARVAHSHEPLMFERGGTHHSASAMLIQARGPLDQVGKLSNGTVELLSEPFYTTSLWRYLSAPRREQALASDIMRVSLPGRLTLSDGTDDSRVLRLDASSNTWQDVGSVQQSFDVEAGQAPSVWAVVRSTACATGFFGAACAPCTAECTDARVCDDGSAGSGGCVCPAGMAGTLLGSCECVMPWAWGPDCGGVCQCGAAQRCSPGLTGAGCVPDNTTWTETDASVLLRARTQAMREVSNASMVLAVVALLVSLMVVLAARYDSCRYNRFIRDAAKQNVAQAAPLIAPVEEEMRGLSNIEMDEMQLQRHMERIEISMEPDTDELYNSRASFSAADD